MICSEMTITVTSDLQNLNEMWQHTFNNSRGATVFTLKLSIIASSVTSSMLQLNYIPHFTRFNEIYEYGGRNVENFVSGCNFHNVKEC